MLGRILVIDDNDAIHEDFVKILSTPPRDPGAEELQHLESLIFDKGPDSGSNTYFQVDSAFDGEHGLAMVKKAAAEGNPYALVFVDRVMPYGWDGLTTITQIVAAKPDTEIIVISAHTDESWLQILKQMGVDNQVLFLRKPFDPTVLKQMALSQTRKWVHARGAAHRISDLEKNMTRNQAALPQSPAVKAAIPMGETGDDQPKSKGSILVVEDNHTNWTVLSIFLSNLNYTPFHAEDGRIALAQCQARNFDLILMDLHMPGLNGFQTTNMMRNKHAVTCPIIAITANSDHQTRAEAQQAGMNDFLAKPIRSHQLEKTLHLWLNDNAAPNSALRSPPLKPMKSAAVAPTVINANLKSSAEPPMDVELAVEEFLGDRILVEKVTGQFLKNTGQALNQIMDACLRNDFDAIERKAHEIKGGAANLGANALSRAAKVVEQAAEKPEPTTVFAAYPVLCAAFGELQYYFSEYLHRRKQ